MRRRQSKAIPHRRRTRSVMMTAIVVASLGAGWISASAALAAGEHAHATLWQGKNDCGDYSSTAFPREGSVSFARSDDTLTVTYRIRGGDPNATYYFNLLELDVGCTQLSFTGTAYTNSGGSGSATRSWSVTGYSNFFVEAYDCGAAFPGCGDYNQTTAVTLP